MPALPRLFAYLVHWTNWPPGWDATPPSSQTIETGLTFPPDVPTRGLVRRALRRTDAERATQCAAPLLPASQQAVMPSVRASFSGRSEPFTACTAAAVQRMAPVSHPR